MSIQALARVFKFQISPSSLKFVLVALADCANEDAGMLCWPSINHICDVTSQDRKTVIASIGELVNRGMLVDTGERRGHTKQIKTYRLCIPETNSTKSGTVEESRFSHQTVPKTDTKQYRKRDTEPLAEPLSKPASSDEVWREEELPSDWHTYAETKGLPDELIYKSWKKFKDHTSHPYRLRNWRGWVNRERVPA